MTSWIFTGGRLYAELFLGWEQFIFKNFSIIQFPNICRSALFTVSPAERVWEFRAPNWSNRLVGMSWNSDILILLPFSADCKETPIVSLRMCDSSLIYAEHLFKLFLIFLSCPLHRDRPGQQRPQDAHLQDQAGLRAAHLHRLVPGLGPRLLDQRPPGARYGWTGNLSSPLSLPPSQPRPLTPSLLALLQALSSKIFYLQKMPWNFFKPFCCLKETLSYYSDTLRL